MCVYLYVCVCECVSLINRLFPAKILKTLSSGGCVCVCVCECMYVHVCVCMCVFVCVYTCPAFLLHMHSLFHELNIEFVN